MMKGGGTGEKFEFLNQNHEYSFRQSQLWAMVGSDGDNLLNWLYEETC